MMNYFHHRGIAVAKSALASPVAERLWQTKREGALACRSPEPNQTHKTQ